MCGGGSQTTTQSTQTDIPEYLKPYATANLERAKVEASKPYEAYVGDRIAGPDVNTLASRQGLLDIAGTGISGLGEAQDYTRRGLDAAAGLGNYGTGTFTQANYSDPTKFTGSNVTDYMSPYMQAVLDSQKSSAILDYERAAGKRDANAINAGAFGGSRRFVQEGMDQEALLRNLSDIDATGRQRAFESAMGQFNADRGAMTDVERARAAELGRVQTGTEASRQFGAGQGLAALQAGQGLVGDLTKQGELERQTAIQNAQLQDKVGQATTADQQRVLDLDYQNFLEKQGYDRDQINFMTSQLSGQPTASSSTQTSTAPGQNPLSQILGAGLSGLSLYNAYK